MAKYIKHSLYYEPAVKLSPPVRGTPVVMCSFVAVRVRICNLICRGSKEELLDVGRLLLLVCMWREAEQGDRLRDGREKHGAWGRSQGPKPPAASRAESPMRRPKPSSGTRSACTDLEEGNSEIRGCRQRWARMVTVIEDGRVATIRGWLKRRAAPPRARWPTSTVRSHGRTRQRGWSRSVHLSEANVDAREEFASRGRLRRRQCQRH
jgi:hypothetical protein